MKKMRKLIDLDKRVLEILENEAIKQNRSLKNLLEHTLEETANRLESPSANYKAMMDDMLARVAEGNVEYIPIEEIEKKYGL